MPLAISISAAAMPLSPAETATMPSKERCAANVFGAVFSGRPVSSASFATTRRSRASRSCASPAHSPVAPLDELL